MLVKTLDQRHPSYDEKALQAQRALYCGGDDWRALATQWLPKHPDEMDTTYAQRTARALYENHVGPIVDMLAASVFAEAPAVKDIDGDWFTAFRNSVDGKGGKLGAWARDRLVDALVGRRAYVWVNLPFRPPELEVDSLAAETSAGLLDAFLVGLTAEQVIDWSTDDRGRLRWVMVRDLVEERASIEDPRTRVHRWTYIDAKVIRRWTWAATATQQDPKPEDDAEEQSPIPHGFGELPVIAVELTEGLHALGKLHDPAVAHIRARNDLSWALHRAAHALLCIKSTWQDRAPVLGPGYYLQLEVADDAFYAEPSGANFELLRDDTKDLREELYRVVQQMAVGLDSSAARNQQSGASKTADWFAVEIVLGALAQVMEDLLTESIRLVAKARRQDVAPVVAIEGWETEDATTWLENAALATEAHRLSPTFTKAVARRQVARILEDSDPEELEKINAEIDAAEVDLSLYAPPPAPGAGPAPTKPAPTEEGP